MFHMSLPKLSAFSAMALFAPKVAGVVDKKRDADDVTSNHDEILKAFKECGYHVTYNQVDPGQCNIPCSRGRLHYLGVLRQCVAGLHGEGALSELSSLWPYLVEEGAKRLPKHRLDAYLYGSCTDSALRAVPSVAMALNRKDVQLPIAADGNEAGEPPAKRQTLPKHAWPNLHKQMLEQCGVSWMRMSCP